MGLSSFGIVGTEFEVTESEVARNVQLCIQLEYPVRVCHKFNSR